jgi:predicted enzyme related to lactoylglutathione lyase
MIRVLGLRHSLPSILISVLFFGSCLSIVRAADFELPALNAPPSTEHHMGKMVWADLVTPDLAAAEKFYGGLFGWTFHSIRAGSSDYAVVILDGRPIAGLMEKATRAGEHRQSAWLTFMAVGDIDGVKRVAVAHGAKVLADSRNYPMRGRQCVLSDPTE